MLPRWRYLGVICTRHLLCVVLLLSVAGIGWARFVPRDPVVVYLVDRSTSMDPVEQRWQRERLLALDRALAERTERVLMTFAGTTQTVQHWPLRRGMAEGVVLQAVPAALQPDTTNLQAALLTSFALTTDERPKRVVLLSDGLETDGQALQAAKVARLEHIPLFPYLPPMTTHADVAITKLLVPDAVRWHEPTSVRVGVENAASQAVTARLVVRGNDAVIFDQRVTLPAGKHLVDVPVSSETLGGYRLTATLEASGDQIPTNNTRRAAFEVIGPPRVLLLSDNKLQVPYVAQVLTARQMAVEVQDLSGIPATMAQLTAYDAVILVNFPRLALSPSQMELLNQYVEAFGGGLLVIGSGGDVAQEAQAKTPLDRILPAWWTLDAPQERKTQRRLSLLLLIDRSSSMTGQRIALTKHGAVELVKQLDPNDLIGVMAFDVRPFVIVPLQPVGTARATIIDRLIKLKSGGGTHFLPALVEAKEQLVATDAVVKHLILLSDGNTMDPNSPFYERLVEECRDQDVTVSTLLVGDLFVRAGLMQHLAQATGGTFYHVKDEQQIPQLIVADTQRMLTRAPFVEGWYRPHITQPHEILQGLREEFLPPLKGYFVMEAKPQAGVSLVVTSEEERADPLLIHWPVGLGRVTMFASDAEARWSAPWVHWDQYQRFWSQIISWTMRRSTLTELTTRVEPHGTSAFLQVHLPPTPETIEQFVVRFVPQDDPTTVVERPLHRVAATQWRASLEGLAPGVYQAIFLQTAQGALVGEARRWLTVERPSASGAPETALAPPDVALLTALAEASGGAVGAEADTIVGEHPTQQVVTRWDVWLLPVFFCLFLVDVALRGETMV